jgi:hypothetical protein
MPRHAREARQGGVELQVGSQTGGAAFLGVHIRADSEGPSLSYNQLQSHCRSPSQWQEASSIRSSAQDQFMYRALLADE